MYIWQQCICPFKHAGKTPPAFQLSADLVYNVWRMADEPAVLVLFDSPAVCPARRLPQVRGNVMSAEGHSDRERKKYQSQVQ